MKDFEGLEFETFHTEEAHFVDKSDKSHKKLNYRLSGELDYD